MITIPTFFWDVDFKQNQLLRATLEKLESHPSDPKLGRIYFNTTEDKIYYRITDKWVVIGEQQTIESPDNSILVTQDETITQLMLNVDNTTLKINQDGEVYLSDDSVDTNHLKSDSVTSIKIKNKNITFDKIQDIQAMTVIGNINNIESSPHEIKIITDMVDSTNTNLITSEGIKLFVEEYFASIGTFRGEFDPNLSSIPQNPNINVGDYWFISEHGTFKSKVVRPSDQIIANIDNPTSPNDFTLIQSSYDEATTTTLGLVMLASDNEVINNESNKVVTAKSLLSKTASNQEALDGIINTKFLTPKSFKFVLDQYFFSDKFTQTFGNNTATQYIFEHNFGTKFVNHVIFTNNDEMVYSSPIREEDKLIFNFVKPVGLNTYNIAIWK